MATWAEVEQAAPLLAARVRMSFDAGRHKTLATLRADGSPRISGTECEFADGELRIGSMPDARKLADLHRDPRCALHGPTVHPAEGQEQEWPGEAKIAGRAIGARVVTPEGADGPQGEAFTIDVTEVVFTGLTEDGTMLRIEWWTPAGGLRFVERA